MWPKRHQKESHEKKGLYEFRIYIYYIYTVYETCGKLCPESPPFRRCVHFLSFCCYAFSHESLVVNLA